MDALPARTRWFAALALAACSVVGLTLGLTKSAPAAADYHSGGASSGLEDVPAARALGGSAALDERAVRKIAREEAQAALSKSAPKPSETAPSSAKRTIATAKTDGKSAVAPGEADAPKPALPRRHRSADAARAPAPTDGEPALAASSPPPLQPPAPPAGPPDQY